MSSLYFTGVKFWAGDEFLICVRRSLCGGQFTVKIEVGVYYFKYVSAILPCMCFWRLACHVFRASSCFLRCCNEQGLKIIDSNDKKTPLDNNFNFNL